MSSAAPRAMQYLRIWLAACLFWSAMVVGCNGKQSDSQPSGRNRAGDGKQAGNDATQEAAVRFAQNREFQVLPVAKFAGRVTVDGRPPKKDGKLFVILTDPKHLDQNALGQLPKTYAVCDADGKFAFGTYDLKNRNDGAVAGKYVVTFVQLHKFTPRPAKGKRSGGPPPSERPRGRNRYALPDDLKNLYSDPDNNAKQPAFNLDLQPPGRDDYHFDLAVGDKNPVAKPAPHAVTYMVLGE